MHRRRRLTRRDAIWASLVALVAILGGTAYAAATPTQYNCTKVEDGGHLTMDCVTAPLPSDSPTPAPSATQTPSPSPSPTAEPSPTVTPTATTPPATTPPVSPSPTSSTPAPTQGPLLTGCFERLAACGYPTTSSTGVPTGTVLTAYTGPTTIRTAGTVIEGKTMPCIAIEAANVVLRRVRITGPCFYGIDMRFGSLTIEDSEVNCVDGRGTGIAWAAFTARRVNIHDCENALEMGRNSSVVRSYLSAREATPQGHGDGIQSQGGNDVLIEGNTFDLKNPVTSSIITNPTLNSGWTIRGNLFAAGAFTIYCSKQGTGWRVELNRFYGPVMTKAERDRMDAGDPTVDRHKPAFGFTDSCNRPGAIAWSGNYRDDNLSTVSASA